VKERERKREREREREKVGEGSYRRHESEREQARARESRSEGKIESETKRQRRIGNCFWNTPVTTEIEFDLDKLKTEHKTESVRTKERLAGSVVFHTLQ